jgi:hypothetical protein
MTKREKELQRLNERADRAQAQGRVADVLRLERQIADRQSSDRAQVR